MRISTQHQISHIRYFSYSKLASFNIDELYFQVTSQSPFIFHTNHPSLQLPLLCQCLYMDLSGLDILPRHLNHMSNKLIKAINERFQEEGGHEEAIELDLSSLDLTSISKDVKKVLDKAKGIEVLVISDNKLTSLEGIPDWKLSSLTATNNKLTDAALARIAKYSELSELILDGNEIKTLEGLNPLFTLKELIKLDLIDNPVASLPGYRELMFSKLPLLEVLDGLDREGNEVEDELDEDDDEDEDEEEELGSEDEDDEEDDSESEKNKKK